MNVEGLQVHYHGDFEQFLEEGRHEGPMQRKLNSLAQCFHAMFHRPSYFLNEHDQIINEYDPIIPDEDLYRWLGWCIYYGRPKEEYPDAQRLRDTYGH